MTTDTATIPAFSDRDHDTRFAALNDLFETVHPDCAFYYVGQGIQITVPRRRTSEVHAWAKRHNLDARDWHYFPLGSDKVPEVMRHDGNYPGSRGFYLYVLCIPTA